MKIRNKLTKRVYRGDKVLLVIDDGSVYKEYYKGYLPKAVIESLILSLEEYELR